VENVLKVNPVLGPQMFQPLLPSIFKGIMDGEVRVILTILCFSFWIGKHHPCSGPVFAYWYCIFSCLKSIWLDLTQL